MVKNAVTILICIWNWGVLNYIIYKRLDGNIETANLIWNPLFQVEPPPPPPTEPAKEEGMETEKQGSGSESKPASEEAPQQKQAEMDVD